MPSLRLSFLFFFCKVMIIIPQWWLCIEGQWKSSRNYVTYNYFYNFIICRVSCVGLWGWHATVLVVLPIPLPIQKRVGDPQGPFGGGSLNLTIPLSSPPLPLPGSNGRQHPRASAPRMRAQMFGDGAGLLDPRSEGGEGSIGSQPLVIP